MKNVIDPRLAKLDGQRPEKFVQQADLGIIEVPPGYNHATALDWFMRNVINQYNLVDHNITDANFPKPSRILRPGDKLRANVFRPSDIGVTCEEIMAFLETKKAVYPGARGAALVLQQRLELLPKFTHIASLDKMEGLWFDETANHHKVPFLFFSPTLVEPRNDFGWYLRNLTDPLEGLCSFFCFNEVDNNESDRKCVRATAHNKDSRS